MVRTETIIDGLGLWCLGVGCPQVISDLSCTKGGYCNLFSCRTTETVTVRYLGNPIWGDCQSLNSFIKLSPHVQNGLST